MRRHQRPARRSFVIPALALTFIFGILLEWEHKRGDTYRRDSPPGQSRVPRDQSACCRRADADAGHDDERRRDGPPRRPGRRLQEGHRHHPQVDRRRDGRGPQAGPGRQRRRRHRPRPQARGRVPPRRLRRQPPGHRPELFHDRRSARTTRPASPAPRRPPRPSAASSSSGAAFVSRGDKSGTHTRELDLWALAGGKPATAYLETGQGMAETLRVAAERRAYTLTDTATFYGLRGLSGLRPVYRERARAREHLRRDRRRPGPRPHGPLRRGHGLHRLPDLAARPEAHRGVPGQGRPAALRAAGRRSPGWTSSNDRPRARPGRLGLAQDERPRRRSSPAPSPSPPRSSSPAANSAARSSSCSSTRPGWPPRRSSSASSSIRSSAATGPSAASACSTPRRP